MGLTLQLASSTAGVLSRITAIPEPASCLLFGTAAFGLLAIRKRFRQRT
ncbi:MAG: PEP-CTERM sorting domain-containing protein [Vicinamibacterales bacterium]